MLVKRSEEEGIRKSSRTARSEVEDSLHILKTSVLLRQSHSGLPSFEFLSTFQVITGLMSAKGTVLKLN